MAVLFTRMILSQYSAAYDDSILNNNEMCSLHADVLVLTGTSNESAVWGLLLELPNTGVYEIELVLYFAKNDNIITIIFDRLQLKYMRKKMVGISLLVLQTTFKCQ